MLLFYAIQVVRLHAHPCFIREPFRCSSRLSHLGAVAIIRNEVSLPHCTNNGPNLEVGEGWAFFGTLPGALFFQGMWGVLKTVGIVIVVFIVIYTIFHLAVHRRAD